MQKPNSHHFDPSIRDTQKSKGLRRVPCLYFTAYEVQRADSHRFDRSIQVLYDFYSETLILFPGNKSAMMSMKIFLARILRNFKVTTSQTDAELVHYLLTRCKSGYRLNFEKRQNISRKNIYEQTIDNIVPINAAIDGKFLWFSGS